MKAAPTRLSLCAAIALSMAALPARADLLGGILKGALKASEHAVKGSVDVAVIAGKASVGATGEAVGAISGGGSGSGSYYKQSQYQSQYQPQSQSQYQPQYQSKPKKSAQRERTPLAEHQLQGIRSDFLEGQARVQGRIDTELAGGKITSEQARSLREELTAIQFREHDARRDGKMDGQEADGLMDAIDRVDSRLDRYLVENMRIGRVRN